MSTARDKRIEKAQLRTLFTVPFFAPGVAKLPVEVLPEAAYRKAFNTPEGREATACTDGKRMVFCGEFLDKLTDPELVTVLCHEVCHCMLGHLWRAPSGVDWDTWNQATDHAVNLMLKEFSAQVMAKRLADPFPFPDPQDAYCADPQFAGLAEEVIYQRLSGRKPPGGGGGGAGGGKGGKPGKGSMPDFGQMVQPAAGQAAGPAAKKLANDWDGTLIQACAMSQGRGELPAGMERFVDELVNPQVPWWELLASWVREQCSDDWDWLKPALEYDQSGFILPSLNGEKVGRLVFATDTSGSIDHGMLAHFQAEKQGVLDELRPACLVDMYCDSALHKVAEYHAGDTIAKDAPGGGGTSFRPVFEHVEKMAEVPKCLVYLTDLDGDFPADPGYPVLWVTWTKGGKAPFGEVIYAGE